MEYRNVGSSGLQVSAVGLGTNNFGGRLDLEATDAVIKRSVDRGGIMSKDWARREGCSRVP